MNTLKKKYSAFGEKLGLRAGIVDMMDDLSSALAEPEGKIMLGGGNPAKIPEVADIVEELLHRELCEKKHLFDLVANYSSPKGDDEAAEIVSAFLREECNWNVTKDNIFFCNGSQSALFMIFNMLAGRMKNGRYSKLLLPFTPEYIGYEDLFVDGDCFVSNKPSIEIIDEQSFKYMVDFENLNPVEDVSCVAVSSPSNPTGKYLEKNELSKIKQFCKENNYPLIYDNAYGWPFPNVQFTNEKFMWDENMITTMSLSKMGLPGLRTGVVVANEEVVERLRCINAVSQLAPNNFGMFVLKKLIQSDLISKITKTIISPFYNERNSYYSKKIKDKLNGYPVKIHESKGTMFIWLWLEGMNISSNELYERLKSKGVLTLSGHHFFIGNKEENWPHKDECLRISLTQERDMIDKGIDIIVSEIKKVFDDQTSYKILAT